MNNPHVRRLCVAVDIRHYHELDSADQKRAQSFLLEILESASSRTDVPRLEWTCQEQGDGELALLPPGIDEVDFVEMFVAGLRRALHRHKRTNALRLRLRVALHQGLTQMAEAGYAGSAVITVSRLCDAPQVKAKLEEHPEADLVLVLSGHLFDDVIGDDSLDLNRNAFSRVRIEMPDKGFYADAWVHLPGVPGDVLRSVPRPSGPPNTTDSSHSPAEQATNAPTASAPADRVGNTITSSTVRGDVTSAGGDVHTSRVYHGGNNDQ